MKRSGRPNQGNWDQGKSRFEKKLLTALILSMDSESRQAVILLDTIADSNEKFIALSQYLRSKPTVIRVLHNLECRKYTTGTMLQGCVDAEVQNGKAICWWLEVHWGTGKWVIEFRVLVNSNQGQETIKEFPDKISETFSEFIDQLEQATSELVDSVKIIDLAGGLIR
jgi:hypothetical protein